MFGWLRGLYTWVLHWAQTPYGPPALFLNAFSESSFFPIPPDPLLIALCLSLPQNAFKYAFICALASVLGGGFGYLIGAQFMKIIGERIIRFYKAERHFDRVKGLYARNAFWAVAVAGFTPIPYKVFTIAAGACNIKLSTFFVASAVSRSARFFLVAGLISLYGEAIKAFIDKYFNLLTIIFAALLVAGFFAIKRFARQPVASGEMSK
ncbi:MAG: cytochrome B [Planctomycetes bacterium DG_23]|nr:MAG: cytochrome B [Planctomycetes bacterium DG_23]